MLLTRWTVMDCWVTKLFAKRRSLTPTSCTAWMQLVISRACLLWLQSMAVCA